MDKTPSNADDFNTNREAIARIRQLRKAAANPEELARKIKEGDRVALSRGITLIESRNNEHREKARLIIEKCIGAATGTVRIGITGVPGVGKSTFIESLGKHLTEQGHRVAVLAVDPTSGVSGGSILGDKTRMQQLVLESNAFIRPSPAGDSLGGVARKTREAIILCEAAGFDVIIIETVGVGQSETAVHSMVDFFLLLKLAGAGDELQGIKRGIMEMADGVVINKADGDNLKRAQKARVEFKRALHLFPPKDNGWTPEVLTTSALKHEGITEVWDLIRKYVEENQKSGWLQSKRAGQNRQWVLQTIDEQLKLRFYQDPAVKAALEEQLRLVETHQTSPITAAHILLDLSR
ncbi:methylmalonyl Co-A mutase-associated GTPase MeaB [Robertkochia marina]|uniref:Methylmalonyl Co-A mutase-associated GTPase MeaB n=1 Tax=Robertkochia marina TaxID=1227945 RepID=A0A4S3LZH7_9FLAO|nr:methylmalonyl Co-A mutase-associated GTPase MeaB [Robertkochia marina]THD65773.1 methylmalonyl Co-A mutase-associated GTPase MeaB [Robertkochia marina]TRZ46543.1 methylmalonyl Co-A mutase-associated GTPase MeaB [Robertkochia marina]